MFIIGICGGTGSGKTTLVQKLIQQIPPEQVSILYLDSYYKDNSNISMEERRNINFDHPDSIDFNLFLNHVQLLQNGESVNMPIYSYLTCTRSSNSICVIPSEVLILEGMLLFNQEHIRDEINMKVFVDAPSDERLLRVIQRDIIERGRSVEQTIERYIDTVRPMHEKFIEPTKAYADIIIPQGGQNQMAIQILLSTIYQKLGLHNHNES